jgi:hypothetical protein
MNIDHRNPRLRRGFAFVALAALLGLSSISLTQCRLVNDTVTGVDLSASAGLSSKKNGCKKRCKEQEKAARKAEQERHKRAVKACGGRNGNGDDDGNNDNNNNDNDNGGKSCRKAEARLHKMNLEAIKRARKDCERNCYNEGAGRGGR